MTKKRITRAAALLLFIAICIGTVWAQDSYWEGKISTAPYGLLPHSGMYAASNAFALDSKVEITHPSNRSTVEVRVVERVDTDGIFMQVSREAAQILGISHDEVLTAKVTPLQSEDEMIEPMISQDKPYTVDPDVNPSAEIEEDGLSVVERYLSKRERGRIEPQPPEQAEVVEQPLAQAEEEAAAEQAVTEEPAQRGETAAAAEEQPSSAQAAAPQADVLPDKVQPSSQITVELPAPGLEPARTVEAAREPRGPKVAELEPLFIQAKDQRYAPDAPELPETGGEREGPAPSLASAAPGTGSAEVAEIRISHIPEPPKADVASADIAAAAAAEEPDATEADKVAHAPLLPVEPEEKEAPEEIPEEADLVLVPAEERPPEGPATVSEQKKQPERKPTEVKPGSAEPVRTIGGEIPVHRRIDTGSYYLQVAAYSKLDLAQARGLELAKRYPVTLYHEGASTKAPYKLMIGPLNEDESGTLLYTFTSRGFRDAFIRKGN